jgi:hypothetical protein
MLPSKKVNKAANDLEIAKIAIRNLNAEIKILRSERDTARGERDTARAVMDAATMNPPAAELARLRGELAARTAERSSITRSLRDDVRRLREEIGFWERSAVRAVATHHGIQVPDQWCTCGHLLRDHSPAGPCLVDDRGNVAGCDAACACDWFRARA